MPALEAQQPPPAIIERSDRFDTQQSLQTPAARGDIRSEFIDVAVSDPEIKKGYVGGIGHYRGQQIFTGIVVWNGNTPTEMPLSAEDIKAQKTIVDAKLNRSFSPQDVIELKAIAGRSMYLVGVTAQTKLAEAEGGRIDINDIRCVSGLKTRQTTYSDAAKTESAEPLKLKMAALSDMYGRAYQRALLCRSQGRAQDEEFTNLHTEALNGLGELREKVDEELGSLVRRVGQIGVSPTGSGGMKIQIERQDREAAASLDRLAMNLVANKTVQLMTEAEIVKSLQLGKALETMGWK